jgi:hypothetical protein
VGAGRWGAGAGGEKGPAGAEGWEVAVARAGTGEVLAAVTGLLAVQEQLVPRQLPPHAVFKFQVDSLNLVSNQTPAALYMHPFSKHNFAPPPKLSSIPSPPLISF